MKTKSLRDKMDEKFHKEDLYFTRKLRNALTVEDYIKVLDSIRKSDGYKSASKKKVRLLAKLRTPENIKNIESEFKKNIEMLKSGEIVSIIYPIKFIIIRSRKKLKDGAKRKGLIREKL